MSRDELALLFRRAGLDVGPETIDELAGITGQVEAMLERVRASAGDGEPMHVFAPLEVPP